MSTPDLDWKRVRDLFDRVIALDPDERSELLDREPERVKSEVERLLDLDSRASGILPEDGSGPRLVDPAWAAWAATLTPGSEVGPYRVVRALGSGGMGVVLEAEERSPRRRVALKTVRAEFFSAELSRRFANEVQMLARLEHPSIARIYAAGTFERAGEECPYYTMELVEDARTIVDRGRQLEERARLELFLEACDAVDFGHKKGVIHRDLKPGNLLVGADGRVKVIDFGLARPDDPALGASPRTTRVGLVLGTLPYMSPEHVSGRTFEIDVQSDVYSLGCIHAEARAAYEDALERCARAPDGNELYAPTIRMELAQIHQELGDLDEAERMLRLADDAYGQHGAPELNRAILKLTLARLLIERGDLDAAAEALAAGREHESRIGGTTRVAVYVPVVEALLLAARANASRSAA